MTERDQVFDLVTLRFRQCLEFIGNGNLVMNLKVEARIARRFCLFAVAAAGLTRVIVPLEDSPP